MHIHRAGHGTNLVRYVCRNGEIVRKVRTHDLNIDGGGQAEIENLADDVRRLEEERCPRESFGKLLAQLLDILRGRMMLSLERYQDLGIGSADCPAVAVGQIDSAGG